MTMFAVLNKTENLIARLAPHWLTGAVLRVALAVPFYFSGLTKWEGFGKLSESAVFLFEEEFKLNIFGNVINYPFPYVSAFAAGTAEIILPVLLVLGLFARFAALGLLIMTAVIQLTIPSGWPLHLTWAAMAIGVLAIGPGRVSVDHVLRKS
jgi:putative oxidoreductase